VMIDTPIIEECPYNLECRVNHEVVLGEYTMFVAEVLETYVDEDKVDNSGRIDISKVNPLVYCATIREYWDLKRKVGVGFKSGRSIIKKLYRPT